MYKREICQIGFRLSDCKNLLSQEILNVTAEANFISVTFTYFFVLFPHLSISTLERDLEMSFLRSDDWCEQGTLRKLIVLSSYASDEKYSDIRFRDINLTYQRVYGDYH